MALPSSRPSHFIGHWVPHWVLLGLALSSASPAALGHKLNLFTYVEGNTVHVEGYFADGSKAKSSDVTAVDSAQAVIANGKTDENGEYSFQVVAPTDVQIVLNAGLGHQAQYLLAASEFGGEPAAPISTAQTEQSAEPRTTATDPDTNVGSAAPLTDSTRLQTVVQRAVADSIKPLAREIDALKNRTTLQDIVGGVGYILGAFGIWAYLQARKQKRSGP